jgi:glycosyltransferase involved in cell wall biosynthesis
MLSTDLQRGGYPLRLVRLARRLRQHGIDPIVGCLAPRGALHDDPETDGLTTFACGARGAWDAGCLWRLASIIRQFDPDVIHSGLFHANAAARLVGRLDRSRAIITSTATIEIERRWHLWLEALQADRSDLHIANSPSVARHVQAQFGLDPARVVVIPNGVDLRAVDAAASADPAELGLPREVPVIVWAGRMDPIKDLTTFVDVIAAVRRRVNVRAVLLGDGPQAPHIKRLIAQRGLNDAVRLAGWRRDVIGWFKAASLLLLTSRTEGSPNVVIEAMAAGCGVIASDIGPCRDLIVDGRHGMLRAIGDVDAFAEAVLSLLANCEARRRLAAEGAARIRAGHDLDRVAGSVADLYRRVVGASDKHS